MNIQKITSNNYSHLFSAPKWGTVEDEFKACFKIFHFCEPELAS